VLRDPEKRKAYDQFVEAALEHGRGVPGSAESHMNPGGGLSTEDAERIFRAVFGFGGGSGGASFVFQSTAPFGAPFGFDHRDLGGASRASGSSSRGAAYAIPRGEQVLVHGLSRAPEHNGNLGTVVAWDEARGRYKVQFEGGASVMLKPRNLTQLCRVEVAGLATKPELNGCSGQNFAFDETSGRYQVLLDSPRLALGLQPANCILPKGTPVTLTGLANTELNDTMARIVSVDHGAARYTVHCRGGRYLKVKYQNIRC